MLPGMPSGDAARILAAIPDGHQRAATTATWCRLIETHPAITALRADARANALGVLWVLARYTDHRTRITRPSWTRIQDITGLSRSTVAKWLRWARTHHLIGHVEQGSTDRYRPGQDPSDVGNRAAVYVLLAVAADTPEEISRTPSPVPDSVNKPSRAREHELSTKSAAKSAAGDGQRPHYWHDLAPTTTNTQRLAAAEALQQRAPITRRISTTHLRSLCTEFLQAGWCVRDLHHALDNSPTGAHPYAYATNDIRHPAGWITSRLRQWRDQTGHPDLSYRQQRQHEADDLRRRRCLANTRHHQPVTEDVVALVYPELPMTTHRARQTESLNADRQLRGQARADNDRRERDRITTWITSTPGDPVDSQPTNSRANVLRRAKARAALERAQRQPE